MARSAYLPSGMQSSHPTSSCPCIWPLRILYAARTYSRVAPGGCAPNLTRRSKLHKALSGKLELLVILDEIEMHYSLRNRKKYVC
jgi:hypothetical protein